MSLKSKVLQDLMEKLHLMPETMGEMDKKAEEGDEKKRSVVDSVKLLMGKGKDDKDGGEDAIDEDEEDED